MPLITVGSGAASVPAGTYIATLVGIRPKRIFSTFHNEERDMFEWRWHVNGPEGPVEVTSLTSLASGPKSRMFEVLTALLGGVKPGMNFEESDLVGKQAMLALSVNDSGFNQVDRIVGVPAGVPAPAAPPVPAPNAPAAPVTSDQNADGDADLPF